MTPIVYLVSGASRGIGLGIVTALAARENVVVFAGARNLSTATDLQTLTAKYPGKVHSVTLVSGDKAGNDSVLEQIKTVAGRLDVVIASAAIFHLGICDYYGPALETPADQLRNHFEVNVVGTHILFQAAYPLLQASTSAPKLIAISSTGGGIIAGATYPVKHVSYGASKAALNFLVRKLHFEYKDLICFPLHPGTVYTDLIKFAHESDPSLRNHKALTVEQSAEGILNVVDNSTREKEGGKFMSYDGTVLDW